MTDQHDMSDAPRDGTQILAWFQPEPIKVNHRTFPRKGRYVLARWFQFGDAPGFWSTHHKGQGKLYGDLLAWWPLPARRAS